MDSHSGTSTTKGSRDSESDEVVAGNLNSPNARDAMQLRKATSGRIGAEQ